MEHGAGREALAAVVRSEASAKAAADALARVAAWFGFDGWLVNVEVPCPARDVPALTLFVRALRAACAAEAAAAVPPIPYTPIVLWYDAVTVDGALAWQDGLTPANAAFFDVADGILKCHLPV